MYCAPDFVKVELMRNGVFASGCEACSPGTEIHSEDYHGSDLSNCQPEVTYGETNIYQCYFDIDIDDNYTV